MAGRYEGRHVFRNRRGDDRPVEVFWHSRGWFWRPLQPLGEVIGPFTTSTEAYKSAMATVLQGFPSYSTSLRHNSLSALLNSRSPAKPG
jgi:hypothetical protein